MRTVARDLGISDVGLAKACRRFEIPLPDLGYWAKIAAGHNLDRIPLPPTIAGRSDVRIEGASLRPTKRLIAPSAATKSDEMRTEEVTGVSARSPEFVISDLTAPHVVTCIVQRRLRRRPVANAPTAGMTTRTKMTTKRDVAACEYCSDGPETYIPPGTNSDR